MFVFTKNKKNGGNPVKDNINSVNNDLNLQNLLIKKVRYVIDFVE
jgi:hypothetical protein